MNPVTFCGRTFGVQEVELMREIAQDYAGLGVTEIARTVCELLDWKRPNGGLKNHECRQFWSVCKPKAGCSFRPCGKRGDEGRGEWMYRSGAGNQSQWSARPKNANRWSWLWWKAQRRADGGVSTRSGITI